MAEFTGRRVKILLENGTDYEGFVHSMDQSVGKLTLEKVTIPSSGKKFQGLKHFFRDDLVSVDVLEEQIKSKKEEKNDLIVNDRRESGPRMVYNRSGTPAHLERLRSFDSKDKLLKRISSKEDLKSDTEQTARTEPKSSDNDSSDQDSRNSDDLFVVISKVSRRFDKAMREIYTQKVIGVALEGVCIGRSGTLCWLNVVIRQRVFLFDVLTMGKECFEEGLKDLLEDGSVLKVMHDCRMASDLLHHQFGVSLCNMFDTQVADAFVYRTFRGHGNWPRYVEGLQASLFNHLDLPQEQIQLMKVRAALKKEDQQVWMERPAGRPLLEAACKNVMHLLDLRLVLMEKMMAEFVAGVDVYLAHTRDANNDEAKKHQSSDYLLPTAFKDLDRITSRNYGNYGRCTQKDTNGFNENCEGLADPDVIHSRDSIWHMGSNGHPKFSRFQGTMYMKKFENLRRMKSQEDKSTKSDEAEQSRLTQKPMEEASKKTKAPGPILHNKHSSTNTDSQSETDSSKVSENTTPNLSNDVNQFTTGMLIRSLANKNGDISESDSLDGFSIRPAGVFEKTKIDRRKKIKNEEVRSTSYYAGPPVHNEDPAPCGYQSEKENTLSRCSPPQSSPELTVLPQLETRANRTYCSTDQGEETRSPETTPVKKSPGTEKISPLKALQNNPVKKSPDTEKISPLKALQNSLDTCTSRREKLRLMCNSAFKTHT